MAPESLLPTTGITPLTEDLACLDAVAPSSIPTLISASTSTSASAAASAYSSASSSNLPPSTGLGPNSWCAKPSNRKRRAAEFPKMPRPPKRVNAGTRDWSNYFEAQVERGVEYSGLAVTPSQPQAMGESRHRRNEHPRHELVVAPQVATLALRSLLGQEKQMVFCDSNMGAMAAMPVFETSFVSLGVSFSATAPCQEMPFEPSSSLLPQDVPGRTAPSRCDHSRHLPSPCRGYPRRSPSPQCGYSRRSPSPRCRHLHRLPSPQREYLCHPLSPRHKYQRHPPSPRNHPHDSRPPFRMTQDLGWSQHHGNRNYEREPQREPVYDGSDPLHTWGASSSLDSPSDSATSPAWAPPATDASSAPPASAP